MRVRAVKFAAKLVRGRPRVAGFKPGVTSPYIVNQGKAGEYAVTSYGYVTKDKYLINKVKNRLAGKRRGRRKMKKTPKSSWQPNLYP